MLDEIDTDETRKFIVFDTPLSYSFHSISLSLTECKATNIILQECNGWTILQDWNTTILTNHLEDSLENSAVNRALVDILIEHPLTFPENC